MKKQIKANPTPSQFNNHDLLYVVIDVVLVKVRISSKPAFN